ncbi:MAG: restriction endonuclease [Bacteroidaceae bacterium]|nr:restriction endonuclease [Bacteroidaceae bacterium]
MNTNTEYEKFTRELCERLALYKGLLSSSVQHNVKLRGKSGLNHQIDVYWEYNKDGIVHRVAIECKNYNQKIPIGRVRDFFGVLYDVGNIKGIMACKEGYQDGAKKFADFYGISLKELRAPRDGETVIGELDMQFETDVTHRLFLINEEWAAKRGFDINMYRERTAMCSVQNREKWMNATHLPLGTVDDYIRDADGRVLLSIEELQKHKPDKHPDDNTNIYCFEDAYVKNDYWGLMKIDEIMFEREYTKDEKTYSIDAGRFVRAILADALGGEKMVIM